MTMTAIDSRLKRRRILIDGFQYHFLMASLTFTGLIVLLVVGVLLGPLIAQLLGGESAEVREESAAQLRLLFSRLWLPLLINLFCLAGHSVFMSHRIAGPLYEFRRLFGAVRDGNLIVRARLREHNYLRKEAAAINAMAERMETQIAESAVHATELRDEVRALRLAVDSGARAKISGHLGSIETRSARLIANLQQFTTRREDEPTSQRRTGGPELLDQLHGRSDGVVGARA